MLLLSLPVLAPGSLRSKSSLWWWLVFFGQNRFSVRPTCIEGILKPLTIISQCSPTLFLQLMTYKPNGSNEEPIFTLDTSANKTYSNIRTRQYIPKANWYITHGAIKPPVNSADVWLHVTIILTPHAPEKLGNIPSTIKYKYEGFQKYSPQLSDVGTRN